MANTHQQTTLEAEADDRYDGNSVFSDGESLASSTTSIGSSILKNREENGRTYHAYKEGTYVLPNDEGENDRLERRPTTSHVLLDLRRQTLTCPIDPNFQIHRVLDIGTGTGIWAIDYADEHPEAKILGIDLSPIQPAFIPPNLSFEIDDLEASWTFREKFDLIHCRMMTGSFANWPKFFDRAFENLSPGGYIEVSDVCFPILCDDDSMKPDSTLYVWSELQREAAAKIGRNLDSAKQYKSEMERVGFTDIVLTKYTWPLNRWPKDPKYKELGMWMCENLSRGLSGIVMALFTRVLGMTSDEVEAYLVPVRKDIRDTKIHAYLPIWTFYARKPLVKS